MREFFGDISPTGIVILTFKAITYKIMKLEWELPNPFKHGYLETVQDKEETKQCLFRFQHLNAA